MFFPLLIKAVKSTPRFTAESHFMDEETITFIAGDRLTHANLQVNPHAAYIFKEKAVTKAAGFTSLKSERKDSPLIEEIRLKKHPSGKGNPQSGPKFLIFFHLDKVLPLIGDGTVSRKKNRMKKETGTMKIFMTGGTGFVGTF